jgi:hypothetical protein
MNQLKRYTIIGTVFVIFLGTISHFFYDWSNNNFIVGLFAPVNESTWEHMKLIFFPMLLFSLFAIPKLKENHPCITSSLFSGILVGTALIPVIFYTYTGILGYNVFILDLLTFILAVIIAFSIVYKLTLSCRMQNRTTLLCAVICVVLICFLIFTFNPPNIGLFAAPL